MKPKEKAKYILNFYTDYTMEYEEGSDMMYYPNIEIAKECSLFCVNEILAIDNDKPYAISGFELTYWKKVKAEIEAF